MTKTKSKKSLQDIINSRSKQLGYYFDQHNQPVAAAYCDLLSHKLSLACEELDLHMVDDPRPVQSNEVDCIALSFIEGSVISYLSPELQQAFETFLSCLRYDLQLSVAERLCDAIADCVPPRPYGSIFLDAPMSFFYHMAVLSRTVAQKGGNDEAV